MAQRVLVVDDEPDLLDLVTDILTSFPRSLEVVRATDGQSAIEAITRERFDLVLMDVHMPGVDGMEALKQIKAIKPDLPVLMITGSDHGVASEALRMGAYGYLPKPMDLRYVEHIVSLALDASLVPAHA